MFHPADHPLERGWVGRIDGEHVTHLAAQTLQSYFTGGGAAREHAVYPLAGVRLLAPVLHPPSIRVFDDQDTFAFANPAAICSTNSFVRSPYNNQLQGPLSAIARLAGVVGAESQLAGFTLLAEWRDPRLSPPKDRDFALGLGPVVVTPDELDVSEIGAVVRVDGEQRVQGHFGGFDWEAACDLAAAGTKLYPGDLLVGPPLGGVEVEPGGAVELEVRGIGTLAQTVSSD
jgi:Fumarylacetoacetate (FAA) hydrolase family